MSHYLRLLHRYVGLAIALFLVIAALTGSLLAFMPELERASAPHLYAPKNTKPQLNIAEYAHAAVQLDDRLAVKGVSLAERDRVIVTVVSKSDTYLPNFTEVILHPADGRVLGTRTPGVLAEGWHNLMPFIYELHYTLLLGDAGWWFLGIVALVWTIDCFTGLIITFPRRAKKRSVSKDYFKTWTKAWKIKTGRSAARFNFDLHRALSLWLWLALLIFAWSSVYMNLWNSVYLHTTRSVMEFHPPWFHLADREPGPRLAPLGWQQAEQHANAAIETLAQQHSLTLQGANALDYIRGYNAYRYRVQSDRDLSRFQVRTEVYIDASTGAPIFSYLPTGEYAGNTVSTWLHTIHRASLWGMPFKIFVALLGLLITVVSVSGVLIWCKKRSTPIS
ncbi:PepSY-associated TM helix domain-containing protein [Gilvimarinus chinensis]|uniref:PepSY-associated TM helix domain-containing protein n=1 Tax=Gilvimarinus chinensis TaxID=396005 RepID=UPI00035E025A|nr:PepSY-associated TM helix domain-containing protein [Gilvimarinus chinensis]